MGVGLRSRLRRLRRLTLLWGGSLGVAICGLFDRRHLVDRRNRHPIRLVFRGVLPADLFPCVHDLQVHRWMGLHHLGS